MTPRHKHLVQASWRQMQPIADAAAGLFYARLFGIDPSLRRLFAHADMDEQKRKLVGVLALAVAGLDDLDALLPTLRALGARHAGYGVQDAHYEMVGAALLWTLKKGLGEAWTHELASAWGETYAVLAGVMREAAAAVTVRAA